ncbi:MAG: methyltransferase domain-containing protein [Candidatus Chisholmbacteria bacterium]|nr:methyltransferase domain-containing protein [Candidatus Chisholmbacteria bacterium]
MFLKNLFLPYDVYSRHKIVAELIGTMTLVLDVGASLKELSQFLPPATKFFSTDIIGGDVISTGTALPFKSKSVDTVVSIDTLEHVPKSLRQKFLSELCRVAKKGVILAAPLGTDKHIQAEKQEVARQKKLPVSPDPYLLEHIREGLPTLADLKILFKPYPNHELYFSGNFVTAQKLFRLHRSEISLPLAGRLPCLFTLSPYLRWGRAIHFSIWHLPPKARLSSHFCEQK